MKLLNKTLIKAIHPRRTPNAYKTQSGKVFIVAGSLNMAGAAILAARAAYRAGAGVVTIAVPSAIYAAVLNAVPQAIVLHLNGTGFLTVADIKTIKQYIKTNMQDVLLIGPGLGKSAKPALALLEGKMPTVIDADALNYLAKDLNKITNGGPYILTPHVGEMQRLLNVKTLPPNATQLLALKTGAVCLLKGPGTQIYCDDILYKNTTGNEGLAKAGSGDILAGIIAALLAQNLKVVDGHTIMQKALAAALCGVYIHGLAADIAVEKYTKAALMAGDITEAIPLALKTIFGKKI